MSQSHYDLHDFEQIYILQTALYKKKINEHEKS